MDLTPTICKDTQTPPLTQPINLNPTKSLSFTNGTLKHHSSSTTTTTTATVPPSSSTAVSYKECLKNHAASIGGHAIDGCGEFMASSTAIPTNPRSLICAACGCHRNFHRRDPQEPQPPPPPTFLTCFYSTTPSSVTPTAPPPPPQLPHRAMSQSTSPSLSSSPSHSPSPMSSTPSSPPPLSHVPPSSYAAPHMLLALGNNNNAYSIDYQNRNFHSSSLVLKTETISLSGRKRYRTKFSLEQKEKMFRFSEKLGWRMQKGDDRSVQEFCSEIGVARGVFKVWMHNNKNTLRKKSESAPQIEKTDSDKEVGNGNGDGIINSFNINSSSNNDIHKNEDNCADVHVSFNGLSS